MKIELEENELVYWIKTLLGAPYKFYYAGASDFLDFRITAKQENVRREIYEWLDVEERKNQFLS